jgi:hypothetical protein
MPGLPDLQSPRDFASPEHEQMDREALLEVAATTPKVHPDRPKLWRTFWRDLYATRDGARREISPILAQVRRGVG